jgi:elongation factor Ts
MQITALRPTALSRQDIPAEMVEREQTVLRESDDLKDKPADRIEKILQGRMEKFFAERALLEQEWVHDTSGKKLSVQQALAQELGPQARIEAFKLVAIGS